MKKHWSLVLQPIVGLPGRSGSTICGKRNAIDQDRIDGYTSTTIADLPPCQHCASFLTGDKVRRPRKDPHRDE